MRKNSFNVIIMVMLSVFYSCNILESEDDDSIKIDPAEYAWTEAFPSIEADIVNLNSGVKLEKKDEYFIWQGDIVLTKTQVKALDETGTLFSESTSSAYQLWTNEIPFIFHHGMPKDIKKTILIIIDLWEKQTNIRFRNVMDEVSNDSNSIPDYIEFMNGDGNWSSLGRIGGKQQLSIDKANINQFTVYGQSIIHAIGHAIGMFNTQNQYDRDEYIIIHHDNIRPAKYVCFDKQSKSKYSIGKFDFESIMLSPSVNNFSKGNNYNSVDLNGSPTMTSESNNNTWMFNVKLSKADIAWVNKFYPSGN